MNDGRWNQLPITHLGIHFCFIRRRHELPQESIKLSAFDEAVGWKEIKEEKIIFGFTDILDLMKTKEIFMAMAGKGVCWWAFFLCKGLFYSFSFMPTSMIVCMACNGTI